MAYLCWMVELVTLLVMVPMCVARGTAQVRCWCWSFDGKHLAQQGEWSLQL